MINRDVLSEAVSFAVKLLPQRSTQAILSGVLIKASENKVTFSSFDYEVSSRTEVDAAVDEEGTVLVSGKLLADIATRLPDGQISFDTEENKILVTGGSARFTLLGMPVAEYPNLPVIAEQTGVVSAEDFSTAVAQVSVAASRDDVTPVIRGVNLEITNNALSLVATDRYRVAIKVIDWDSGIKNVSDKTALVPARTLAEVGKTFSHAGTIGVTISGDEERELIAFSGQKKTVTSLLIKGNFPPVKKLFPEKGENYAVINTADIIEATRRVSLVLEKDGVIRYNFEPNILIMEGLGIGETQAYEELDIHLVGEGSIVSLKPSFLLDSLSAINTEFVRISFTQTDIPNKPGPVLITAHTSQDKQDPETFRYLLQPNLLLR